MKKRKDILDSNLHTLPPEEKIIALAGNPNVGKSTVFNSLTGLNQHTGNWPGKTVSNACGTYTYQGQIYTLVDLPGTYSLMAHSAEEEVARDFLCFHQPDAVIIVADATCLERNLNLVLQTLEICPRAVLCVNLLDEAAKKQITVDLPQLEKELGIPVVGTTARNHEGLEDVMAAVARLTQSSSPIPPMKITYPEPIETAITMLTSQIETHIQGLNSRWVALQLLGNNQALYEKIACLAGEDFYQDPTFAPLLTQATNYLTEKNISREQQKDMIATAYVQQGEKIYQKVVTIENDDYAKFDRKVDRLLTSKTWGIPMMLLLLGVIFWLTIVGANYPSQLLSKFFFTAETWLLAAANSSNLPLWFTDMFICGVFRTLGWVISVMLPPMAIFFPLFTLLEDLGYLPRLAFNLDKLFKSCHACGKQALTICMGFGCNATGVMGCRIIDSPRERLIAILTNSFAPCNGRFPTLIMLANMFFIATYQGWFGSILSAAIVTCFILLGLAMTFLVSKILSQTILKGMPSSFALELPPYRKPQVKQVIIRSLLDRTLFVLGRAVSVAAPAGLIIWLAANITIGEVTLLTHAANFLDPLARIMGLDGYILTAFILGFPANEIVFPIIIMSYLATGSLIEMDNLFQLKELLLAHGWTTTTALCTMLFSLIHFPCSTTCLTIKKETGSWKWTLLAMAIPTLCGILLCILANLILKMLLALG